MRSRTSECKLFAVMKKPLEYSLIAFATIAAGGVSGVVAKKVFAGEEVKYGAVDFKKIKPDCDKIIKNIESYTGPNDVLDEFSASDVFNYSLEKFRRCENNCSFSYGVADTIIKQVIQTCTIKNGNEYFEESVSKSSMVSVANRMYQSGIDGDINLYKADKESITINETNIDANYDKSNLKGFKHDDYSEEYGKTINEVFIYLIANETLKESSYEKLENGYRVSMTLDPDLSTYFYKHQMKNISNLDKFPIFEYVTIKYEVSKDFTLRKLSVDEKYTATMVVDATIHGTLETYFFPNEFIEIPELNEQITYIKGE